MGLKGFQAQVLLLKVPRANPRSSPTGRLRGTGVKESSDTPSFPPPLLVWLCLMLSTRKEAEDVLKSWVLKETCPRINFTAVFLQFSGGITRLLLAMLPFKPNSTQRVLRGDLGVLSYLCN